MYYPKWIKYLFVIAGLYDGILGTLFLAIPLKLFSLMNITPPNHIGYVQFPACLLITFAIMFFTIAADPVVNRNLIIYGVLLKTSYSTVVFLHWLTRGIPAIWVLFAFLDLVFLAFFMVAYKMLKKP